MFWRAARISHGQNRLLQLPSIQPTATRTFRSSALRFDQKEEGKPSFQGQLYESTTRRLHREREDEARFAQAQEARHPRFGQRTMFLSFSMQ